MKANSPLQSLAYKAILGRLVQRERYGLQVKSRGPEKLQGIKRLLAALGHPEKNFQVVHIAGTNGKGMTAAMCAALAKKQGLLVGLYTSPHLTCIRERIALNGAPLEEGVFADVGKKVLDQAEILEKSDPTLDIGYFDLLTAMGFLAFSQSGVELAILETGLGGASDATNTTDKLLSIITPIGLDHLHVLGHTLEAIAGEKLGICRPATPTLIAPQPPGLGAWMEARIREKGSKPLACGALQVGESPTGATVCWPDEKTTVVAISPHFRTAPRFLCAATALEAAEVFLGPVNEAERAQRAKTALTTPWPGRLEYRENLRVSGKENIRFSQAVLDGGHNPEALQTLVDQLKRWQIGPYTLILSLHKDKMIPQAYAPLAQLLGGAARIITLAPQTPRAPDSGELLSFLEQACEKALPPHILCKDPLSALQRAGQWPESPLVAAGSLWNLGALMAHLEPA